MIAEVYFSSEIQPTLGRKCQSDYSLELLPVQRHIVDYFLELETASEILIIDGRGKI